jgi:hypothetical protein
MHACGSRCFQHCLSTVGLLLMKAADCCLWSVPKWLYPRTECAIEDALVVQAIVMTCGRFGELVFAL